MVICNVTEHLHSRFDEIDIIERCDWYSFPIKIRQIFPIIIQNSQKMDFLKVFGNITVSRETCKLVIQSNFNLNNCLEFQEKIMNFFSLQGGSSGIFNLYYTSSILKITYILWMNKRKMMAWNIKGAFFSTFRLQSTKKALWCGSSVHTNKSSFSTFKTSTFDDWISFFSRWFHKCLYRM